jgi:hypothetical protein
MRLPWPEKIALALFALITLIMLFLGSGGAPDTSDYCRYMRLEHPTWTSSDSYCFVTAAEHWSAFVSIEALLFWKLVVPVWVATRLIDLMGGGIAARRADRDSLKADGRDRSRQTDADTRARYIDLDNQLQQAVNDRLARQKSQTDAIDLAPEEWTSLEPEWRRRLRS